MSINFESVFSIHDDALLLRSKRSSILASNIANADTPNFKARDLDFDAILRKAGGRQTGSMKLSMSSTNARHISAANNALVASHSSGGLKYRVPLHASLDGNTVDSHVEQAQFSENSLKYQTSFTFLNGRIKGLMLALRGE